MKKIAIAFLAPTLAFASTPQIGEPMHIVESEEVASLNAPKFYHQVAHMLGDFNVISLLMSVRYPDGSLLAAPTSVAGQLADFNASIQSKLKAASWGQATYNFTAKAVEVTTSTTKKPPSRDEQWALFRRVSQEEYPRGVYYRHRYGRVDGPCGSAYVGGSTGVGRCGGNSQWHEMVHNLGFHHGSDTSTAITGGGSGTFNAPMRAYKGWLRYDNGLKEVTVPGEYTIHDLDVAAPVSGRTYALVIPKIQRYVDKKSGRVSENKIGLFIEFRPTMERAKERRTGAFIDRNCGPRFVHFGSIRGVDVISAAIDPAGISSRELHGGCLPVDASWTDSDRDFGAGWSAKASGYKVTTLRRDAESITVRVE